MLRNKRVHEDPEPRGQHQAEHKSQHLLTSSAARKGDWGGVSGMTRAVAAHPETGKRGDESEGCRLSKRPLTGEEAVKPFIFGIQSTTTVNTGQHNNVPLLCKTTRDVQLLVNHLKDPVSESLTLQGGVRGLV